MDLNNKTLFDCIVLEFESVVNQIKNNKDHDLLPLNFKKKVYRYFLQTIKKDDLPPETLESNKVRKVKRYNHSGKDIYSDKKLNVPQHLMKYLGIQCCTKWMDYQDPLKDNFCFSCFLSESPLVCSFSTLTYLMDKEFNKRKLRNGPSTVLDNESAKIFGQEEGFRIDFKYRYSFLKLILNKQFNIINGPKLLEIKHNVKKNLKNVDIELLHTPPCEHFIGGLEYHNACTSFESIVQEQQRL